MSREAEPAVPAAVDVQDVLAVLLAVFHRMVVRFELIVRMTAAAFVQAIFTELANLRVVLELKRIAAAVSRRMEELTALFVGALGLGTLLGFEAGEIEVLDDGLVVRGHQGELADVGLFDGVAFDAHVLGEIFAGAVHLKGIIMVSWLK
jgi:hypothetical protein